MALIKCPECGQEISDKSDKCIHCGFPLKADNQIDENYKYEFYLILTFPRVPVPLAHVRKVERTRFSLYRDGILLKDGLLPFDIVHLKSSKDFKLSIRANEYGGESTLFVDYRSDLIFIQKGLEPVVLSPNWLTLPFGIASLAKGIRCVTDRYSYKQGIFSAKRIGPMSHDELLDVLNNCGMWCKAYTKKEYTIHEILVNE